MKKPHDYKALSDVSCKCGKRIKANVVARKSGDRPLECYPCWTGRRARERAESVERRS